MGGILHIFTINIVSFQLIQGYLSSFGWGSVLSSNARLLIVLSNQNCQVLPIHGNNLIYATCVLPDCKFKSKRAHLLKVNLKKVHNVKFNTDNSNIEVGNVRTVILTTSQELRLI